MDPNPMPASKQGKNKDTLIETEGAHELAQPLRRSSRIAAQVAAPTKKGRNEVFTSDAEDQGEFNTLDSELSDSPSTDTALLESLGEEDGGFVPKSPGTSPFSRATASPSPPSSRATASPSPTYTPARTPAPRGITNITVDEADLKSNPPPGPSLTTLVDAAKNNGEIPRSYQSAIVRRVDGVWLVPQKCFACALAKKSCDRRSPCSFCEVDDCSSDGFMVKVPKRNVSNNNSPVGDTAPIEDHSAVDSRGGRRRTSEDAGFDQGSSAKSTKRAKGSGAYYDTTVQEGKPEPFGKPPVWSNIRQTLCEALPYYRAYQSGVYSKNGIVYGFLCDKEASKRSVFNEEIMIATCGGGKSVVNKSGLRLQTKGVRESTSSRAFINTMNRQQPVAIIAGGGNPGSPCRLPAYYCVLGWFHVTHVWCEFSTERTLGGKPMERCMVRLQKIDLTSTSWWAPKGSPSPPPIPDFEFKAAEEACKTCGKRSKTIYNAGWACLNVNCKKRFFKFATEIDHDTLKICDDFIRERVAYEGVNPDLIAPPPPTLAVEGSDLSSNLETKWTKAIVCPKCNCCVQKLDWHQWECETPDCGFIYRAEPPPVSIGEALSTNNKKKRSSHANSTYHDSIQYTNTKFGAYESDVYLLPSSKGLPCGIVVHMKSNEVINQQRNGPDDLFDLMQKPEFPLRRGVVKGGEGKSSQVLTSHFSTNWGAPYKYRVENPTLGFEESPQAVIVMLSRLAWAAEAAATPYNEEHGLEKILPLNEILTIGYRTENKIHFHDDGEKELGPTVVSVSLGCPAVMNWRPAVKAWGDLTGKKKTASDSAEARRKINNPVRLSIRLNHGDMMVMHSAGVQRNYEHAVDPEGSLRFAITGRHIKIATLEEHLQEGARKAAIIPEHRRVPDYDGDVNAMLVEGGDGGI